MKELNYTKAIYTVSIEVERPISEVFRHLTHDVAKFWPEDFDGASAKLNDEFVFSIGNSHYSKNKVAELLPDKKVVWLVTESVRKADNYDWTGTRMGFELRPKGNHTILEFTYDGPVLADEVERLKQVCDMTIKDRLYNFLNNGK
ncbi:MAG: SRPBCC domain-containing protein [Flavipsychrobacter sp.]